MLKFDMGVTREDKIRNEYIRGTVKVDRIGRKMREGRLKWYEDVTRRDQEYVGKKSDGNGVIRKDEKREAKEKIFECSEGGCGGSWCDGEGH